MKHILLNNLGRKQSGNKIWPVNVTLQGNFFYQNSIENMATKLVPGSF